MGYAYEKAYNYDEIMNSTCSGSIMDNKIMKLINDLDTLDKKVAECEQAFHGKGQGSIYKSYSAIANAIGHVSTDSTRGSGLFGQVSTAIRLCQVMYKNADEQKRIDESMFR